MWLEYRHVCVFQHVAGTCACVVCVRACKCGFMCKIVCVFVIDNVTSYSYMWMFYCSASNCILLCVSPTWFILLHPYHIIWYQVGWWPCNTTDHSVILLKYIHRYIFINKLHWNEVYESKETFQIVLFHSCCFLAPPAQHPPPKKKHWAIPKVPSRGQQEPSWPMVTQGVWEGVIGKLAPCGKAPALFFFVQNSHFCPCPLWSHFSSFIHISL